MKFEKLHELIEESTNFAGGSTTPNMAGVPNMAGPDMLEKAAFFVRQRAKDSGYIYGPATDVRVWNEDTEMFDKVCFNPVGYREKGYKPTFFIRAEEAINDRGSEILLREGGQYTVWDKIAKPVVRDHIKQVVVEDLSTTIAKLVRLFPEETVVDIRASYDSALGNPVLEESSGNVLDVTGGDLVFVNGGDQHYAAIRDMRQLKLGDPVSRDDRGQIIPLDMRFDKDSEDVRF